MNNAEEVELSDMEISDDDNDDNGGGGGGDGDRMNVVNHFDDDDDDDDDKIMLSMIKQAPSISNVFEEFDTCDARLVEIDGHKLKKKNEISRYHTLVQFSYDCRRKIILERFSCCGSGPNDVGGIISREGKKLERCKECHKMARKAVTKYNRLNKDGKLKLEKLIKVNITMGFVYYMTFSAINRDTGKSGIYQAALRGVSAYVLGLFRDWSNDKILAILSITGADKDLAAIRKMISGTSGAENLTKI